MRVYSHERLVGIVNDETLRLTYSRGDFAKQLQDIMAAGVTGPVTTPGLLEAALIQREFEVER